MKFPSNLNCDGKIVSEMGPRPIWDQAKIVKVKRHNSIWNSINTLVVYVDNKEISLGLWKVDQQPFKFYMQRVACYRLMACQLFRNRGTSIIKHLYSRIFVRYMRLLRVGISLTYLKNRLSIQRYKDFIITLVNFMAQLTIVSHKCNI